MVNLGRAHIDYRETATNNLDTEAYQPPQARRPKDGTLTRVPTDGAERTPPSGATGALVMR